MDIDRSPASRILAVREVAVQGFPAVRHPDWVDRFPWLEQGTTTRRGEAASDEFDLRMFGEHAPSRRVDDRWAALLGWSGFSSVVHARQVHGALVRTHIGTDPAHDGVDAARADSLRVPEDCDGHVTDAPGLLLTVSIADCVPVSVVDPAARRIALLHAGWRGVAEGILERGLAELAGSEDPSELFVHLGPSICGRCYEVGPEVFEALDRPRPAAPNPIDLRAVLAERAVEAGVEPSHVSLSERCTRCEGGVFFSHRGGDAGRQIAFLGVRR